MTHFMKKMETASHINPMLDFSGEFTMIELAENVKEVSFNLSASPPGCESGLVFFLFVAHCFLVLIMASCIFHVWGLLAMS